MRTSAAALLILACTAPAAFAQSGTSAEAGWKSVVDCAARPDDRARHACLDGVLRQAGLLTAEREARERRSQFGLERPPAAAVAAPPPVAAPAPAPAAAPAPLPKAEPAADRVDVRLASVTATHDGKLIVTTTEDAVWRQADSGTVSPQPTAGDTMSIRKASLGSYLCQVRNTLAFRCARSK